MLNLLKRIPGSNLLLLIAALLAVVGCVVGFAAYSAGWTVGHTRGLDEGKQQALEQAVQQAQTEANAAGAKYYYGISVQTAEQLQWITATDVPKGPDPKSPPPHDAKYYMGLLQGRVAAAASPQAKESEYWASVCVARRELVGAPITVWKGSRFDTYVAFGKESGPYYVDLVSRHQVSFSTQNVGELGDHIMAAVKDTPCPVK